MFLQRNLAHKVEMSPDCTIFVRIIQGVYHVRGIDSLIECQRIVNEICSLLQSQGNLTRFTEMQKWRNIYLNHHFSPFCHYLFCETYMVQRPQEYQINDVRNVRRSCQSQISAIYCIISLALALEDTVQLEVHCSGIEVTS